ncbi:MAG TPA: HD domain-containing phosphohydrolase [Gemmatimonadaceae bacterium]|nr:HD domain-containing phosphohydrolase [Gemmatimonadaceae bacterium]
MKNSRFTRFAVLTAVAAVSAAYLLYTVSGPLPPGGGAALVTLGLLALGAELLTHLLPHGARGSIAFIPYLATVLVVPHWESLLTMLCVATVTQVVTKTRTERAVFNIAQHMLTLAVAILVYKGLGGESFLLNPNLPFAELTRRMGLPAISAYAVSFFVNTLIVSAGYAVVEGTSPISVWKDLKLSTIGIDMIASPVVFVFAWLYAAKGTIAAAFVWVPIVGIRQVHKANLELEQTNQELLELMAKSIEARDPYTSGHSRRVQHYSTIIARALGLADREIGLVSRAALLHDVGKIHEKYGLLLSKAERLSPAEWTIMQQHPGDGAELVATMSRLRDLVVAIRHHHENWDGTGYPDGLVGDRIPLAARIIRFADTMDAMLTERPYRGALSSEAVTAEIIRCRGTQFDPEMADRLLASPGWSAIFTPPEEAARYSSGLTLVGAERRLSRGA